MTQNLSLITFLDDHLRLTTTTTTTTPPSSTTNTSSPQSIIESWSHLRARVRGDEDGSGSGFCGGNGGGFGGFAATI
ncbi:hypothetical protein Droror1_Dr00003032 [Drosera rotundifolia]